MLIPANLDNIPSDLTNLIPKYPGGNTHGYTPLGAGTSTGAGTGTETGAEPIDITRKISHGIGGAGNFRRPTEALFPEKSSPSVPENKARRRSNVWSKFTGGSSSSPSPGTSPSERRSSILGLFRRGSVPDNEFRGEEEEREEGEGS